MKIHHFENNPEVQFDTDLIARMVHAINKAVSVNIPQQLQDQPLETINYIAHMRGDWINENLRRSVVTDGVDMVGFRRASWRGRLLVDHRSNTSYSITTMENLRRIPKKHRLHPHFLQTILSVENAGYEGQNSQMCFLPDVYSTEEYEHDYSEIFAGLLNPDSGYHHCVIAYSTEGDALTDIRLEFLDPNFYVVDELSLTEYIRPDFAKLTEITWDAEALDTPAETSKSLPQLKAAVVAKLREAEKLG